MVSLHRAPHCRNRGGFQPAAGMHLPGGKVVQYEIVALPDGGRMLTYFDLSHLKKVETELRTAKELAESHSLELADRVRNCTGSARSWRPRAGTNRSFSPT